MTRLSTLHNMESISVRQSLKLMRDVAKAFPEVDGFKISFKQTRNRPSDPRDTSRAGCGSVYRISATSETRDITLALLDTNEVYRGKPYAYVRPGFMPRSTFGLDALVKLLEPVGKTVWK